MIELTVPDLVAVASRVLGVDTGAALGLLDPEAAEAALAAAAAANGDGTDPAAAGAALLHALVRHRPFAAGNDRIALVAMTQALALAGHAVDLDPPATAAAMVDLIGAGALDPGQVAAWLAPRTHPRDTTTGPTGPAETTREKTMRRWLPGRTRGSGGPYFHRFTPRARQAVVLAQSEARRLDHTFIGTEHVLLGLLQVNNGLAARALEPAGVTVDLARTQVESIVGRGKNAPSGHIPFTPRAKNVLRLAVREALALGHNYIGTEHILLGLIREGEGVAAQVLGRLEVDLDALRDRTADLAREVGASAAEGRSPADGDDEQSAIASMIKENIRQREEIERLRAVLHRHGIEPDEGTSQTA